MADERPQGRRWRIWARPRGDDFSPILMAEVSGEGAVREEMKRLTMMFPDLFIRPEPVQE